MIRVPSPPSGFADLLRFGRELYDYLCSRDDSLAPNTLTTISTRGTTRSALAVGGDSTDSPNTSPTQFRQLWDPDTDYFANDIVEVSPDNYPNNAGTYITFIDVPAGGPMPGGGAIGASGTVHITGGAVTSVTLDDPGFGFLPGSAVIITGDGSGATAHLAVSAGLITGVVIDDGGSGYTHAFVSFDTPEQPWIEFSRGHFQFLQLDTPPLPAREAFDVSAVRRIVIDSAGASASGSPIIKIMVNAGDLSEGVIELDTALILGKRVYPQVIITCEATGPMQRVFVCSDSFPL